MASLIGCPRFEDYTIGWISALPMELAAGIQMLDEMHHPLLQDVTDMSYVFGSIGAFPTVMACLPTGQYGPNSAARVAVDMRSRFPNLRFCLLVGIGGGVPSTANDIRLGDIVVSQPNGTNGGVVQYDFGKNTTGGLERTGWLNGPPDVLLKLLSSYQARNIDPTTEKSSSHPFRPRNTKHLIPNVPDTEDLFLSDYEHIDGPDCSNCDSKQIIQHDARGPMVHYGTIASGNQVIKNAKMRDKLSKELGNVLCFDMEAAGIMNALPCLVVRGISDYADSHKNEIWQSFAAITAAAFAKELFPGIPESHVKKHDSSTALSTISWLNRTRTTASRTLIPDTWSVNTQDLVAHEYFARCHLSDYDCTAVHLAYTRSRCPDTTLWILDDTRYANWCDTATPCGCLWLTGKIGSGKTIITSTVIEHILREHQEHNDPPMILHYFCRYAFKEGLTATALVASLIQQTLDSLESRNITIHSEIMKSIDLVFGRQSIKLEYEMVVEKIFLPLLTQLDKIIIVMDGLDECDTEDIFKILDLVRRLLEHNNAKFFLSSRESLDIAKSIPSSTTIFISNSDSGKDICTYIDWRLKVKLQETRITEDEELLLDIRTLLADKADGMILWVYLQIENIWEDCSTDIEIRKALCNLPKDLNETYVQCMKKIGSNRGAYAQKYAARLLPWMLAARKPFTMTELREALAINEEDGTFDRNRMPSSQILLRSCANLITLSAASSDLDDSNRQVGLVHHTLRQFLASQEHPLFHDIQSSPDKKTITLADLCIRHLLSKDYNLSVQQARSTPNLHLEPPVLKQITSSIPSLIRPFLPKVKPIALTINHVQSPTPKLSGLPAVFHYARDQWAYLTRDIHPHHELFPEFQSIALQPNLTYRLHPWHPLGQSLESHCSGLLAWSIVHEHEALFDLVVGPDARIPIRRETLEAPIPQFGAMNAVLLAVRHNAKWALTRMTKFNSESVRKLLLSEDINGWNSLHHAVDAGCHELIGVLSNMFYVPYKSAISDGGIQTPISIAVAKKDVTAILEIARLMPETFTKVPLYFGGASQNFTNAAKNPETMPVSQRCELDESHILARNLAIQDGSTTLLRVLDSVLLSDQRIYGKFIDRSKQAFYQALQAGNVPISIYLLEKGYYKKRWFVHDVEWRSVGIPILLKTRNMLLIQTVLENVDISAKTSRGVLHHVLIFAADAADDALLTLLATFFTFGLEDLLERAIEWRDEKPTAKLCQLISEAGPSSIIDRAVLNAAAKPYAAIFEICLRYCNDWDVKDENGNTPLMLAARYGYLDHLRLLLKTSTSGEVSGRVDINAKNRFGKSALELCCRELHRWSVGSKSDITHCARLLIQSGSSIEMLDDDGLLRILQS